MGEPKDGSLFGHQPGTEEPGIPHDLGINDTFRRHEDQFANIVQEASREGGRFDQLNPLGQGGADDRRNDRMPPEPVRIIAVLWPLPGRDDHRG